MDALANIAGGTALEKAYYDKEPTVTQKLERQKASLEAKLADVNNALNALNKNPEIANILDLIQKAVR